VLSDFPISNLFAALETVHTEVVADRFNNGGLNLSAPSRLGGFLSSWSQTRYRMGNADISSAVDGTPLLFPSLAWWNRVDVGATFLPLESPAPGLAVMLSPLPPSRSWSGVVEGFASGGRLTGSRTERPPSVASLKKMARGNGLLSGPLTDRIGLSVGAEWADGAVDTATPTAERQHLASVFSQIVFAPSTHHEIRGLGIVQHASGATAAHVQAFFESHRSGKTRWRLDGSHTYAERASSRFTLQPAIVERLKDGSVPWLAADRARSERQWSGGMSASLAPAKRHTLSLAADVSYAQVSESLFPGASTIETVDGQPTRLWIYAPANVASRRHAFGAALVARDRILLSSKAQLDALVRLEHTSGSARGAANGIAWTSATPAIQLRWDAGGRIDLRLLVGARRTPHRLLLDMLAVGDPASPAADVYRWESGPASAGPLIARVGPGVRADASFSVIDPHLRRPYTDEFTIGAEARPRQGLSFGVTGLARRQARTVQLINVGVAQDGYRAFTIPDANADLVKPDDDQLLTVYERLPASFGRDRYMLTNPPLDAATLGAMVISAAMKTNRMFVAAAATAAAGEGSGANRGFRAFENDPDVPGEVLSNPNASTYARGRLFSDRAYTIKSSMLYRLPADVRVGIIARYQDGQPFARLVLVPGLNQGTEVVQAFARGRSRFAFTGTLDVRLQKRITLGGARLDVMVDVYNLPNMRKEVEEYVVTGPRFREPTIVQPPRSVHIGFRAAF
jgi:hypothetical protein